VLDPQIQAGKPCVDKTRVTTDVVAERVAQGEPAPVVAEDLRLTIVQVNRAVKFEDHLGAGQGMALSVV
jgi:uncharacterized protein (DUF433 family)